MDYLERDERGEMESLFGDIIEDFYASIIVPASRASYVLWLYLPKF
jgi:hypothetical protein